MIVFCDVGRMGNTFFQIASSIAFKKRYGQDVGFAPQDWFRHLELQPTVVEEPPAIGVSEQHFHFNWAQWDVNSDVFEGMDVRVDGYLQSFKYWKEYEEEVRKALVIDSLMESYWRSEYEPSFRKPTIAIHIRRGDYVGNTNYVQLPISYYLGALYEHFHDFEEKYNLLIFSDDIEYARIHFQSLNNVTYVDEAPIVCQILMRLCDHFILSNSTFAWWGAYMGEKPHSKIIRPDKYFSGDLSSLNDKDFWEPHWTPFRHDYKFNLWDTQFTIPVFYDHPAREENLNLVINTLRENFRTEITVCENISKRFQNLKVDYIHTDYPQFHRTRMLNKMAQSGEQQFVINYDADVLIPPLQILKMVQKLRVGYDMVLPYDGMFYNIDRKHYQPIFASRDVGQAGKLELVWKYQGSYGGVVGFNRQSFWDGGGENEKYIAYAPEDQARWYRYNKLGFKVDRIKGALYHLDHERTVNSTTRHKYYKDNEKEFEYVKTLSVDQLWEYVHSWRGVPLSKLYVRYNLPREYEAPDKWIWEDDQWNVPCTESIHLLSLETNSFSTYEHYINKTGQADHSLSNFLKLVNNFDIEDMPPIVVMNRGDFYTVHDGAHRLAALVFYNYIKDYLPYEYCEIRQLPNMG